MKKNLIILINLGSPNKLSTSEIKKFLSLFLSDKRVVNLPKIIWYPILYGFILPFRSKRLFKLYSKIWHNNDSPLIYYTKKQAQNLSEKIDKENVKVKYAFCYARPTIIDILNEEQNIDNILFIPLYPQFSSSTTLAVYDQISKFYSKNKIFSNISLIRDFHQNKMYIKALVEKIENYWKNDKGEKLIFSFHSLPKILIKQGDTYYGECLTTGKLIAQGLNIKENDYLITFQSKFGYQKWLTPATNDTLINLAKEGIKKVDIICPGFISDCLETLEEINILNRELFLSNGGIKYNYINCLNDSLSINELILNILKEKKDVWDCWGN